MSVTRLLNWSIKKSMISVFLLFCTQAVLAQEFNWAPDFPEGSMIPLLEAPDQNSNVQTLDSLSGERGLMLFFSLVKD